MNAKQSSYQHPNNNHNMENYFTKSFSWYRSVWIPNMDASFCCIVMSLYCDASHDHLNFSSQLLINSQHVVYMDNNHHNVHNAYIITSCVSCVWAYVCDIYISLSGRWPEHTILLISSQQAMSHSRPEAAAGGAVRAAVFPRMWMSVCVSVRMCSRRPSSISPLLELRPAVWDTCPLATRPQCLTWLWVRLCLHVCRATHLCVFDEHVAPTPQSTKRGPPPPLPHVSVTTMMVLFRLFTEYTTWSTNINMNIRVTSKYRRTASKLLLSIFLSERWLVSTTKRIAHGG